MICIVYINVLHDLDVYLTQLEILAAEINGPVNVKAVHFDAVALIKRVLDNGTLILIYE